MKKNFLVGVGILLSVASTVWAADTTDETRDISAFTEVALKGPMDVDIVVGKARSVRVVADDTIIEDITTEVHGDRLEIRLEGRFHGKIRKMHVYVTAPKLEAAALYGSGDMNIEGDIEGDFDFALHGSGDARIEDLNVNDLEVSLKGSGDITLDGSCNTLDVELKGSGDVNGKALKCASVEANIMGSGDIAVYASKKITASVMGSGDIDVYGKPEGVRTKIRGSGDINVH